MRVAVFSRTLLHRLARHLLLLNLLRRRASAEERTQEVVTCDQAYDKQHQEPDDPDPTAAKAEAATARIASAILDVAAHPA